MPLIRNNGRYGELGHWGKRSNRRFSKKKILLLGTLLSLALIFVISHNGEIIPIVNAGDYNTNFSHTRTLIFGDQNFNGPSGHAGGAIIFNSKVNATCAVSCGGVPIDTVLVFPALTVTLGDTIIVSFWASSAIASTFTVTDSQSNTYTLKISIGHSNPGLNVFMMATQTVTTGSDTITLTSTAQDVFAGTASDYSGAIGFGNTFGAVGSGGVGPTTGTSTVTITSASTSSFILEFMAVAGTGGTCRVSAASGQNVRNVEVESTGATATDITGLSGINSYGLSWSCSTDQDQFSHIALELTQSPLDFSKVRWNFNSTCVSLGGGSATMDYSLGTTGSRGSNCSSADIMISKAPVNLQTVSGRMMETIIAVAQSSGSGGSVPLLNASFTLRTNATLPSFTENYNPVTDIQTRLLWNLCPASANGTTICSGGKQSLYIARDNTKSISQETLANDLIINASDVNFHPANQNGFQTVLNFTGPNNFMAGNTNVTSANSASSFQEGQSYYILFKATFNTLKSPCPTCGAFSFLAGTGSVEGSPNAFTIWSVPASCNDPLNKTPCGLGTPTPVFQFNPLDPSTWGNAIIQGLLWVFSIAVPSGLRLIATVLLQVIQVTFNVVGNFFGWGNIGDNIVTFLSGLPSFFGQIGTALGWFGSIVSSVINTIIIANLLANPYFAGLLNVLNDFKVAIGSGIIVNFLTQIAIWFPTSYMIILISTYFLFVFLKGLHGFFDWLHIVKWSSFQLVGLFALFLDVFVALITAILGRLSIISPGHKFPRIPHPNPGSLPKIQLSGEIAFFDDPTAWFLAFTGMIFTMMWAGTSAAGLPANTQSIITAMQPLFLTLFGVGFMILILYIPGFLLGKLHEKGIIS